VDDFCSFLDGQAAPAHLDWFDSARVSGRLDAPDGAVVGQQLVALERDRPDAVLAVTDLLAMVIISQLIAARLSVPDDVAVMGCDHDSAAWGGAIPLTSMSMEVEEMGAEPVRLLLDEIEHGKDGHDHRQVLLTPPPRRPGNHGWPTGDNR
jgi:LacI family transcriptional regulator